MTSPRLILGSGSPQRRTLLQQTGYQFEVVEPDPAAEQIAAAEQGVCSNCGPAELVLRSAAAKAVDVARQVRSRDATTEATVIACDTVAECGGQILGKPQDEDHARGMLDALRGNKHRVYSGLCVWPLQASDQPTAKHVRVAVTELVMDSIDDQRLDDYLASGLWRGKAGAFGYQDRVGWLRILKGSESNVIGLPLELLEEMLKA